MLRQRRQRLGSSERDNLLFDTKNVDKTLMELLTHKECS